MTEHTEPTKPNRRPLFAIVVIALAVLGLAYGIGAHQADERSNDLRHDITELGR